ncbi:MAG TPA: transaldolase [Gaiellaceae bacterium]|nr:transaldolase [Gaiellaceae bacterium]
MQFADLKVRLFADGADKASMLALADNPLIAGFTTNPTLMRKAGVTDYHTFARDVLAAVPDRPISFEVVSDDFDAMEREARALAAWGANVCVKIPVTNTRGEPAGDLVHRLAVDGIHVNVTAILTLPQVEAACEWLAGCRIGYISVFAGRIADTGRDPVPVMAEAVRIMSANSALELVWASPREILNVVQADSVGCHIVTLTDDLIAKLPLLGKDLDEFSLETVAMFAHDARSAGLSVVAEPADTTVAVA